MPAPISLVPPSPGDGSRICKYDGPPDPKAEYYESDAYARHIEKRRRKALEKKAYRNFRELFAEDSDGNARSLHTGTDHPGPEEDDRRRICLGCNVVRATFNVASGVKVFSVDSNV